MNERGKSDSPVVPAKPPNKAVAAEVVEERGLAKGNTDSATRPGRSAGHGVSQTLDRVREAARRDKDARFTALLHHVDLVRLQAAYWAIRPKVAHFGESDPSDRSKATRQIGSFRPPVAARRRSSSDGQESPPLGLTSS
jgi:hypothetical protein